MKYLLLILSIVFGFHAQSQFLLKGRILQAETNEPLFGATIYVSSINTGVITDFEGKFSLKLQIGVFELKISNVGYKTIFKKIEITKNENLEIELTATESQMDEVVVTGTMNEMTKMDSPVPVDIISPKFLFKNPTPSIFEALQNVNGVRPQINCNVCSTGDIHINGLEGPYTMVLIDGMPIVSSLSTVYGLSGIPNSLIERVELVKGAASTLYGSEALGGLINIITKNAKKAPILSVDTFTSTWGEINSDIAVKYKVSPKMHILTGINHFHYNTPKDLNNDNFTDLTLQKRISLFNKITFERQNNKEASIAIRLF